MMSQHQIIAKIEEIRHQGRRNGGCLPRKQNPKAVERRLKALEEQLRQLQPPCETPASKVYDGLAAHTALRPTASKEVKAILVAKDILIRGLRRLATWEINELGLEGVRKEYKLRRSDIQDVSFVEDTLFEIFEVDLFGFPLC